MLKGGTSNRIPKLFLLRKIWNSSRVCTAHHRGVDIFSPRSENILLSSSILLRFFKKEVMIDQRERKRKTFWVQSRPPTLPPPSQNWAKGEPSTGTATKSSENSKIRKKEIHIWGKSGGENRRSRG